jgi:hypothetical protein
MGAWGPGAFENDAAIDWLAEIEPNGDALTGPLMRVLAGDFPEADEASEALAAAELIAALHGRPADGLPEEAAGFIEGWDGKPPPPVDSALSAIDKILSGSELLELWSEESDDGEPSPEFRAALADLKRRLRGG